MRYLITGGAGFIGSHLAERLVDRGDHVVLLDNLSTGSMENIRHLKTSAHLEYHLDSIENRQLVAELVDDADVVVHLAAAVGVRLIVESPVRTIETNVNGTQLILEAASKKKKLVLLASTSEVYGKNTQVPFREDADLVLGATTKGRWSYAASKALAYKLRGSARFLANDKAFQIADHETETQGAHGPECHEGNPASLLPPFASHG